MSVAPIEPVTAFVKITVCPAQTLVVFALKSTTIPHPVSVIGNVWVIPMHPLEFVSVTVILPFKLE